MGREQGERYFKKSLFQPDNPKPGEEGYLRPGFIRNEKGEVIEEATGNIVDEMSGEVIKEKPSEGLLMAREQHPDWKDNELMELARIYQADIDKARGVKNVKRGRSGSRKT